MSASSLVDVRDDSQLNRIDRYVKYILRTHNAYLQIATEPRQVVRCTVYINSKVGGSFCTVTAVWTNIRLLVRGVVASVLVSCFK